jgi:hypothetical protein
MMPLFNNHCICVPVLVLEAQQSERQSVSSVETQSITYSCGGEDGEQTVTISIATTMHQTAVLLEDGLQGTVLNVCLYHKQVFRCQPEYTLGPCNIVSKEHYCMHMLYCTLRCCSSLFM